tara:strand:- start:563 stop:943 length:381 start_codon:yes stop_codon:yes gene_type:complete
MSDTENQQIAEQNLVALREYIKEYVTTDDTIRKLTKDRKLLNDRKSELSLKILSHMNQLELDDINIGNDGKLQKKESKTTQGLSMPFIKNKIESHISDQELVGKIVDLLKNDRPTKTKFVLKRTLR